MATDQASTKYYEALNETSDAMIDAVRAANDRGHRFTTALIEQAQENQRDAVEFTVDRSVDFGQRCSRHLRACSRECSVSGGPLP